MCYLIYGIIFFYKIVISTLLHLYYSPLNNSLKIVYHFILHIMYFAVLNSSSSDCCSYCSDACNSLLESNSLISTSLISVTNLELVESKLQLWILISARKKIYFYALQLFLLLVENISSDIVFPFKFYVHACCVICYLLKITNTMETVSMI